jgi:hypothetical protein
VKRAYLENKKAKTQTGYILIHTHRRRARVNLLPLDDRLVLSAASKGSSIIECWWELTNPMTFPWGGNTYDYLVGGKIEARGGGQRITRLGWGSSHRDWANFNRCPYFSFYPGKSCENALAEFEEVALSPIDAIVASPKSNLTHTPWTEYLYEIRTAIRRMRSFHQRLIGSRPPAVALGFSCCPCSNLRTQGDQLRTCPMQFTTLLSNLRLSPTQSHLPLA